MEIMKNMEKEFKTLDSKSRNWNQSRFIIDNKGPEIRTIKLEGGKDAVIVAGQDFTITTDKTVVGNNKIVAVTYEGLKKTLKLEILYLLMMDFLSLLLKK